MNKLLIVGTLFLGALGSIYFPFINYLEPFEEGIAWNFVKGELRLQNKGWNFTSPFVLVARVDSRPVRICVTTAGRGFNCKLVQFEPSAYKEFTATEGFYYYWWANRISFNFGYDEEYRGMRDLLRGYAYGVKQYSFVTTLRDFKEPQ